MPKMSQKQLPDHMLRIEKTIFSVRGKKIMLDSDLAGVYGVQTKVLNQAIKRNSARFPPDFMFRLTPEEVKSVRKQKKTAVNVMHGMRSQTVTASKRNIRYLPHAFTEHGAIMAATVLNSERAVIMSIYVIRAFIRIREVLAATHWFEKRLSEIEKTLLSHDITLRNLYEKIRPLLLPSMENPRRRIGFHP